LINFKIFESSSKGNCYLLESGKNRILIDPGIPFKRIQKYLSFDFTNLSYLVTHNHIDHVYGIKALQKFGIREFKRSKTLKLNIFEVFHNIKNRGFGFDDGEDRLLFAIDTNDIFNPNKYKGLTKIAIECNYDYFMLDPFDLHSNKWHMEFENCKQILKKLICEKTKEVYLLHISKKYGDKERFKNEIQNLYKNVEIFI
jgi:phosphoribosyl 1,2-cyclic phosphodiesterase